MLAAIAAGSILAIKTPVRTPLDDQVDAVVAKMSWDEKVKLIGGINDFYTQAIPSVGLRALKFSDGPVGIRCYGPATAYTSTQALSASFDPDLAKRVGIGMGEDARARGVDVWLGPGVNLARIPQNGRNWEYMGEDPFLVGTTASNEIEGAQSQGIAATIKHFAANEHENERFTDNSQVDESVLRELYLKPFEMAARDAKSRAFMCSYNKLNGPYTAESQWLTKQVLRKDWGYDGLEMSDWGAVHSTLGTFQGGLDLEMPKADYMTAAKLKPFFDNGQATTAELDEKVRHIVHLIYELDEAQKGVPAKSVDEVDQEHRDLVKEEEAKGAVLLKNANNTLPLDPAKVKHILVVGHNATAKIFQGGGSGYTTPRYSIDILDALKSSFGPNVDIQTADVEDPDSDRIKVDDIKASYFLGYKSDRTPVGVFAVQRFGWQGDFPTQVGRNDDWSAEYNGSFSMPERDVIELDTESDDGIRVYIDGKIQRDQWHDQGPTRTLTSLKVGAGKHTIKVEYYQAKGGALLRVRLNRTHMDKPLNLPPSVASADAVIAVTGFSSDNESEGRDRSFGLPAHQARMLKAVTAANPRTVVVMLSGGAVDCTPWLSKAGALIQAWYPGQEGSLSLADIITGKINPSGHLPVSWPRKLEGTYYENAYPPVKGQMVYREGRFMGYRWFDKFGVKPLFPFGYGLSYTDFDLKGAQLDGSNVTTWVTNTGSMDGETVVQIYARRPVKRPDLPVQVLVGYKRVKVAAGARVPVSVTVSSEPLQYWLKESHRWELEHGVYKLTAGLSSRSGGPTVGWKL